MANNNNMGYFGSLRKCIKEIGDIVNDVKKAKPEFLLMPEMQTEANNTNIKFLEPEEIEKKCQEMESKIFSTRIATSKVKTNLKHKLDVTTSYSYDIEDLILDIEDEYKTMEKKLVQFGYSPLEIADSEEVLPQNMENNVENTEQEVKKSATPKLPRLMRKGSSPVQELLCDKPETENADKTPVLCLEEKPIAKSSSVAFPKVAEKYGEVARRLDFE